MDRAVTHRAVQSRGPKEGRRQQTGETQEQAQRAAHVTVHEQKDRGGKPIVTGITALKISCHLGQGIFNTGTASTDSNANI